MFAPIEADSFESPLQHLIKCTFSASLRKQQGSA